MIQKLSGLAGAFALVLSGLAVSTPAAPPRPVVVVPEPEVAVAPPPPAAPMPGMGGAPGMPGGGDGAPRPQGG